MTRCGRCNSSLTRSCSSSPTHDLDSSCPYCSLGACGCSSQRGYHYLVDAETPTRVTKIRETFRIPSGPHESAVVGGVILLLAHT